jgi:hypothetical protein
MTDRKLAALEMVNQAIRRIKESMLEASLLQEARDRMATVLVICEELQGTIEADWPSVA